tara:strand:- start:7319 stop:8308 length:990 start_codon:yes stop_codon:yes gene_type:complete
MIIAGDLSIEVPDTNAHHWNLEELSDMSDRDNVLMYGYNCPSNMRLLAEFQKYKRKIYFNNWAPCEFAQDKMHDVFTPMNYEEYFDEVYSICPYTCEWMNALELGRKYRSIFYPFHKDLIPSVQEKKYDVIYHGGIHGAEHVDCLEAMLGFNYRYVTMTHHINNLTRTFLPYATNVNLPFNEKINLVAKSKISVCYNLVHAEPLHVNNIRKCPDYKNNQAFSTIGDWNVFPQFKTRMHEGAISRTLNLVMKDEWNIAERYYVPGEEFMYFENKKDLRDKIHEISKNWDAYQPIVDKAFKKALSYTTEKFVATIKEPPTKKGNNNDQNAM